MATRLTLVAAAAVAPPGWVGFPSVDAQIVAVPPAVRVRAALIFRGPEPRCAQTAAGLGWRATAVVELADLDAGRWTGKSATELIGLSGATFTDFLTDATLPAPAGESLADVADRAETWCLRHVWPDGRVLVLVAPMVARAVAVRLLELPMAAALRLDVPPLGAVELTGSAGRWNLRGLLPFRAWSSLWSSVPAHPGSSPRSTND